MTENPTENPPGKEEGHGTTREDQERLLSRLARKESWTKMLRRLKRRDKGRPAR